MCYTHRDMAFLRRVLYVHALISAVVAVALLAAPRPVLEILGQPGYPDHAWPRLAGIQALALALLLVLVGHRVTELWWWSWAFVVWTGGTAALLTLHAAFGVPPAAGPAMWWVAALVSWSLAGAYVWGLGRAGATQPPP